MKTPRKDRAKTIQRLRRENQLLSNKIARYERPFLNLQCDVAMSALACYRAHIAEDHTAAEGQINQFQDAVKALDEAFRRGARLTPPS